MSDLTRLPGNPVGFFGLQEPFDRRELKRAYGKAIRKYKPETHAAEFQLIREAYEKLEKNLRYGRRRQDQSKAISAWDGDSSAAIAQASPSPAENSSLSEQQSSSETPPQSPRGREPLSTDQLPVRQLALVDPSLALRKLLAQTRMSPQDYYLAAVFADAKELQPSTDYLKYLIDGLVVHPHDPGLVTLATEYLCSEIPDAMITEALALVTSNLRTSLVYRLTETLWIRLAEIARFEDVENRLTQTERSIHQTDPAARTTFYLRILRSLIWKASPQWSANILSEIEAQSASLDYTQQFDLEFLSELHPLLHDSDDSARFDDPVRAKIIDALRLACLDDNPESASMLVSKLSEIARDSAGMRKAFSVVDREDHQAWVMLGFKLIHQVQAFDESVTEDEVPTQRIVTQTVNLISDLETTAPRLVKAINSTRWWYKVIPLIGWMMTVVTMGSLLIVIPAPMILDERTAALVSLLAIVLSIVGSVMSYDRWIFPRFLEDRMRRKQRRNSLNLYVKHWRARLFRFAQANPDTLGVHTARIQAVCAKTGRSDLGNTIIYFIQQDAGLSLFSALQTVLR